MSDPRRLLSQTGTPEALLLGAVHDADPPDGAKGEVWRRIGLAAGAGVAVATAPIAAQAAASTVTKTAAQAGWLSVIKWFAVVGALAPVAGVAVHSLVAAHTRTRESAVANPASPVGARSVTERDPGAGVVEIPLESAPAASGVSPRSPARAVAPHVPVATTQRSSAPYSLDVESGLLRHARAELEGGDANGALADVSALAARFPHGALVQEREVVAIQALLAQRQRSAAASRTADFLRVYPNSPYADALRRALEP